MDRLEDSELVFETRFGLRKSNPWMSRSSFISGCGSAGFAAAGFPIPARRLSISDWESTSGILSAH